MLDLNRYLRRFWRLATPPGRPGRAAVPVDRAKQLSDEFGDVFAAIDAVQHEADRIREESEDDARRRLQEAEEQVARILADARAGADQQRAEEHARHRGDIRKEADAALADARQEAEQIRSRCEGKLDELAGRIVERLLHSDEDRAD